MQGFKKAFLLYFLDKYISKNYLIDNTQSINIEILYENTEK